MPAVGHIIDDHLGLFPLVRFYGDSSAVGAKALRMLACGAVSETITYVVQTRGRVKKEINNKEMCVSTCLLRAAYLLKVIVYDLGNG